VRVLHWYPNFLGGGAVANAVLGLARGQQRAGADVRIACADHGGEPVYGRSDADELIMRWRPRWTTRSGALTFRGVPAALREEVRAFSPDVVHAHAEFNPDNVWAVRIAREAVVVLSPQGAFDPGVFRKSRTRSKRAYVRAARPLLYGRLDAFHALSPREEAQAHTVAPGVPTYVVPQGGGPAATADPIAPAARSATTELVFVGRIDVYTKGLDVLVKALAAVGSGPAAASVRLTLVGPDFRGGRAVLEDLAAELGVADGLAFTGALPGADVARVIDQSDGAVLVSRHEGLSLAATEALVRGKPLVLSSETGHASYAEIASAPSVLVVPPRPDAIEAALRTLHVRRDELRDLALRNQPAFAELFSWDRVAQRHLETYDTLGSAR
jgi:glycosyltransferase involved in cell wall biosynthesis